MAKTITPAPVKRSVEVTVSQAKAFEVFTKNTSAWWPKTHHVGKAALAEAIIEPKVNGRWYEIDEDGTECQWGYVIAWSPPDSVTLAWQLNAQFQFDPDLVTEVEIKFIALGSSLTRVELEHRLLERFGDLAETVRGQVDGGWPRVLAAYATFADG